MDSLEIFLTPLWLLWPAMVANSFAVLTGGGTPMDFGRSWKGKRILGDGKTWRGFFGGSFCSIGIGYVQIIISDPFSPTHYGFGSYSGALPILIAISFGALLGDALGAFIKRRMGLDRGAKVPILDQYDFLIGALLLALIIRPDWVIDHMISGYYWTGFLFLLVLILVLHKLFNMIGYKMGKKDVPW